MGDVFVFSELMFLYSIILGIIIGVVFNIFDIVRIVFTIKDTSLVILDIVFMLIVAMMTFTFALAIDYGIVRFYMIAGEIVGFLVYYFTIMKIISKILLKIIAYLKKLHNFIKKHLNKLDICK